MSDLPTKPRQELLGLQYIRCIAALLVVIDHADVLCAMPKYFDATVGYGFLRAGGTAGVDLFFVLSGFIIVYVGSPREQSFNRGNFVKGFLERRFVRIVPFLWFCIFLHALLRGFGRNTIDVSEYLRSFFLWPVGDIRPKQVWTLRHELWFYLFFALSHASRFGRVILIAYFVAPLFWWANADELLETGYPWLDFYFSRYNLLFGAGYLLGQAFVNRWITIPVRALSSGWIFLLGALLLMYVNVTRHSQHSTTDVVAMASICSLIVVVSLMYSTEVTTRFDGLAKLIGDASYSIYLTHDIFLSGILGILAKLTPWMPILIVYAFVVTASVVGGILIHLFIEIPLTKSVRQLVTKRGMKAAAV